MCNSFFFDFDELELASDVNNEKLVRVEVGADPPQTGVDAASQIRPLRVDIGTLTVRRASRGTCGSGLVARRLPDQWT